MILFINTGKRKKTEFALVSEHGDIFISKFKKDFNEKESRKLLPGIEKLLKKQKINWKSLKGIIVVIGPGGFTSLRLGAIIANTLGYVLKIPVVGLPNKNEMSSENLIIEGMEKIKRQKEFNLNKVIVPFYGKEPNIT